VVSWNSREKSNITATLRFAHSSVFFCFQARISDLELYENLLWETIAIVDIFGVRKSEHSNFERYVQKKKLGSHDFEKLNLM
jgi:hypothetical protein